MFTDTTIKSYFLYLDQFQECGLLLGGEQQFAVMTFEDVTVMLPVVWHPQVIGDSNLVLQ